METAVSAQREYYAKTAEHYDCDHLSKSDEHSLAIGWLISLIDVYQYQSILDVGCGTGRCLRALKEKRVPVELKGIEPVRELREIGQRNGLSNTELVDGDALNIPFADQSFDVVCSFGVLHHIKVHNRAVSEMCRVARRAVFISDCNNFGQGGALARMLKQIIYFFGLWGIFDFVRTRGKRYHYSDGDGIYYSYSVLKETSSLRKRFEKIQFMSTLPSDANLLRTASHIAVFARRD